MDGTIREMPKNTPSIGIRLRELVARSGLTMSAVATAMGYSGPSSLQRYLSPEYGESGALPIKTAAGFHRALVGKGEPPIKSAEIYALAGMNMTRPGPYRVQDHVLDLPDYSSSAPSRRADIAELIAANRESMDDLPLYGTDIGEELYLKDINGEDIKVEKTILNMKESIDQLRRPASLLPRHHAYAILIAGDSMYPRFSDGETVLIDSIRQAAAGEDVVVQLFEDDPWEDTSSKVSALLKRLVRRTSAFVELEQFNPPARFQVDVKRISVVHRIISWREVLSV